MPNAPSAVTREFLLGLLIVGGLSWNLCCCLYSAVSGDPLYFVTTSDGTPFYLIAAAPWLTSRTTGAAPWSGLWWSVVLLNLSALGMIATIAALWYANTRRKREAAQRAERKAAIAAETSSALRPRGTKSIHLVSSEQLGRAARNCWVCVAVLALMSVLIVLWDDPDYEMRASLLYLGIMSLGPLLIWLGYRRAHGEQLLFDGDRVQYLRGRHCVWSVTLSDVVAWRHESSGQTGQSSTAALNAIVLSCGDGSTRRISAGWLGMPTEFFSQILQELTERTGLPDSAPPEPDLSATPLAHQALKLWQLLAIMVGLAIVALLWVMYLRGP